MTLAILTSFVLAVIGLDGCTLFCRVDVAVVNAGLTPLTDLTVSYTGGRELIRELWPGESREFSINPSGESDVEISFADATGQSRSRKIDVYFEHNYRGRIEIRIDTTGKVALRNEISTCLL